ncbi:chemotaxis protein CheW [Leucothrix arctica]|uniref:CheW-like domain-containing protein n=1 Tax=Leucothrix arctica TaxID=1481894 RepID=A0A317C4Q9_9GAMM|nr:chemotaxis protein CheW [Leucothrix arctica]PWQ93594.1 hypothetical protein DKT75_18420 [Leucothrix arctica]
MSNEVELPSETAQENAAFYYTTAGNNVLLESDIKTEIVEQPTIFPMPHASAWCSGLISLRGKIIPLLDMAFMLESEQTNKTRWLLILEATPLPPIAIKIDCLPSRFSYTGDDVVPIENEQHPHWLLEKVETDELALFKANHSALFNQLIAENTARTIAQNIENTIQQDTLEDEA